MSEQHRFTSWVRLGAGAARQDTSSTITVRARVEGVPVSQELVLPGPGDVTGIARGIIRRSPPPNALGASPVMFPLVEMQPADLPWRYSPAMPGSDGLVPWIALVVVPAVLPITAAHGALRPVIEVPVGELPAWPDLPLWCHAQLTGPFDARPLAAQIADRPHAAIARLLSPRRLRPGERYRAMIVPTFEVGRRVALGESIDGVALTDPAWHGGVAKVRLPIYDSWELAIGDVADFETLARRLRGLSPDALAPMSIALGSLGVTETLPCFGILRPPNTPDVAASPSVADALARRISTTEDAVGAPLHGAGPAGRRSASTADADWLAQLNLDPRWRALAGVGADVVRARQEELVAAAWDRAGAIRQANRIAATAQLSTLARRRLIARTATRPPERLIALAAPALPGEPVAAALRFQRLSAVVRRAARPSASWMRDRAPNTVPLAARATAAVPVAARPRPTNMVTFSTIRARVPAPAPGTPPIRGRRFDARVIGRFAARIEALRAAFAARPAIPTVHEVALPALDAHAIATGMLAEIDRRLAAPFAMARVRPGDARALGAVAELVGAPDLSRPFADDVAALAPRLFSAGVSQLPIDRVAVLEIDRRAVESILVGANHELARELAWREFPLDARATLLSTFWDRRGAERGPVHDIPPIASWTQPLGNNSVDLPTSVIVIRGELIRRFPDAIVGHVAAVADPETRRKPADGIVLPRFRGQIGDDTIYVGLPADLATLRAGLGSYLVILERPGAVRFGLDAVATNGAPERWDELAWSHVGDSAYVPRAAPSVVPATPAGLQWARSAAHMAAITERPAVRLSIHIDELLREDTDGRP